MTMGSIWWMFIVGRIRSLPEEEAQPYLSKPVVIWGWTAMHTSTQLRKRGKMVWKCYVPFRCIVRVCKSCLATFVRFLCMLDENQTKKDASWVCYNKKGKAWYPVHMTEHHSVSGIDCNVNITRIWLVVWKVPLVSKALAATMVTFSQIIFQCSIETNKICCSLLTTPDMSLKSHILYA